MKSNVNLWWVLAGFFYLMYDERRTQRQDEPTPDEDAPAGEEKTDERARKKAAKLAQKQAVKAAYQAAYEKERSGKS